MVVRMVLMRIVLVRMVPVRVMLVRVMLCVSVEDSMKSYRAISEARDAQTVNLFLRHILILVYSIE